MNLVRHEAGFSTTENRFPTKGTCLAIYSRCVNAELAIEEVLGKTFPWCSSWSVELKELFGAYVEAKQAQNVLDYDDLLLYWAQMLGDRLAFPRKDKLSARGTDSSNPLCSSEESRANHTPSSESGARSGKAWELLAFVPGSGPLVSHKTRKSSAAQAARISSGRREVGRIGSDRGVVSDPAVFRGYGPRISLP